MVVPLTRVETVALNGVLVKRVATDAGTIGFVVTGTTPVDLIT